MKTEGDAHCTQCASLLSPAEDAKFDANYDASEHHLDIATSAVNADRKKRHRDGQRKRAAIERAARVLEG